MTYVICMVPLLFSLRLEKERRGSFEIYRTVPKLLVVSSKNNLASKCLASSDKERTSPESKTNTIRGPSR